MILYAWYAAKLIDDKPSLFVNVNNVCFPVTILKTRFCVCENVGFIQCAHCKLILCFTCFHNNYHPKFCNSEDE